MLVALVSLTGIPYSVFIPVFAKEILHGSAHTFVFLMTAGGCSALIKEVAEGMETAAEQPMMADDRK